MTQPFERCAVRGTKVSPYSSGHCTRSRRISGIVGAGTGVAAGSIPASCLGVCTAKGHPPVARQQFLQQFEIHPFLAALSALPPVGRLANLVGARERVESGIVGNQMSWGTTAQRVHPAGQTAVVALVSKGLVLGGLTREYPALWPVLPTLNGLPFERQQFLHLDPNRPVAQLVEHRARHSEAASSNLAWLCGVKAVAVRSTTLAINPWARPQPGGTFVIAEPAGKLLEVAR